MSNLQAKKTLIFIYFSLSNVITIFFNHYMFKQTLPKQSELMINIIQTSYKILILNVQTIKY